jgi:hypothetical protein
MRSLRWANPGDADLDGLVARVGDDVGAGWGGSVESVAGSQTHIAASGFHDGEKITISAALSGRFWSMQTASNLKAWTDWYDGQGAKLTDTGIDLAGVMAGFIFPEDLAERPEGVLIAAEWPWQMFTGTGTGASISYAGATYPVVDDALQVADYSPTGPFRIPPGHPGLADRLHHRLHRNRPDLRPGRAGRLEESQTAARFPDSVSTHLQRTQTFDVLIDDDRAHEAADLVG